MSYEEFLIALENIISDKVSTVPTTRHKKIDTSAPLEIGMAAKGDGENSREERDQRIMDIELQAVYRGTGKDNWSVGKGPHSNAKVYAGGEGGKDVNRGGKNSWQKGEKGGKGQEKGCKDDSRTCWTCSKAWHSVVPQGRQEELVCH